MTNLPPVQELSEERLAEIAKGASENEFAFFVPSRDLIAIVTELQHSRAESDNPLISYEGARFTDEAGTPLVVVRADQHSRAAEAVGDELRAMVHQPNPTDPTRWDIAPGKHKAFSALCARLSASPTSPSPATGVRVKPDTAMARHWIDRYAAGIDEEPQMDRILDALGVGQP